MGLAIGIWASDQPKLKPVIYLLCGAIGFASNYMLLTGAFVVCASPIVGSLLAGDRSKLQKSLKRGTLLAFNVGLGLVAAWIIHLGQVAAILGSVAHAWTEQVDTARIRALIPRGDHDPTRIMLIGRYSDWVARFFFFKSLTMIPLAFFLVWLQKVSKEIKLKQILAIIVATLASYAWVILLKNHSIDHPHVNPRIFFVLYFTFSTIIVASAARRQA